MEMQRDSLDGNLAAVDKAPALTLKDNRLGFLLAEHSGNQSMLIQRAMSVAGMADTLQVVADGETAIDYLRGSGSFADRATHPMPKVVLLDLDLPRKDGFEVLSWMRMQSHFKSLVIVVFTALNREADANRARAMGADFYLTKPNTFDELVKMTRCLYEWVLGKGLTPRV